MAMKARNFDTRSWTSFAPHTIAVDVSMELGQVRSRRGFGMTVTPFGA